MSPIGTSNSLLSGSPNENINAGRRRDRHRARLGGNRQWIECHLPIAGIIRGDGFPQAQKFHRDFLDGAALPQTGTGMSRGRTM